MQSIKFSINDKYASTCSFPVQQLYLHSSVADGEQLCWDVTLPESRDSLLWINAAGRLKYSSVLSLWSLWGQLLYLKLWGQEEILMIQMKCDDEDNRYNLNQRFLWLCGTRYKPTHVSIYTLVDIRTRRQLRRIKSALLCHHLDACDISHSKYIVTSLPEIWF